MRAQIRKDDSRGKRFDLEDQKEEMPTTSYTETCFLLVAKGSCCASNMGDGVGVLRSWRRRRMRVRVTRTEDDTAKKEGC